MKLVRPNVSLKIQVSVAIGILRCRCGKVFFNFVILAARIVVARTIKSEPKLL